MKFVEATDLKALSPEQINRAQKIIAVCKNWCMAREKVACDLPEHLLPQANWSKEAPNAIYSLYEKIANGNSDTLRLFRFYTQPFSGFDLYEWRRPLEKSIVHSEAEILSRRIQDMAARDTNCIIRYKQITVGLPEKWVIRTPEIPGEVGWLCDGRIINPDILIYQKLFQDILDSGLCLSR